MPRAISGSVYSKVQFIAYEVPTAQAIAGTDDLLTIPPGNFDVSHISPSPKVNLPVYSQGDALTRLQRLAYVLQMAYLNIPPDSSVLKIFVAPEFYFRPDGRGGFDTYNEDEMKTILADLQIMFTDPVWSDWLIVPGTIFWHLSVPDGYNAINTLPYGFGGPSSHFYEAMKTEASRIDGLTPWARDKNNTELKKVMEDKKYLDDKIFSIGGKYIGAEICLEHWLRTLRNYTKQYPDANHLFRNISIQLLVAAGMPLENEAVITKKHGLIMRNDGLNPPSQLLWVQGYDLTDDFKDVKAQTTPNGILQSFYDIPDFAKVNAPFGDPTKKQGIRIFTPYNLQ